MPSPVPTVALDVAPLRGRPAGVGVYVANLARALAAELPSGLPGRLAVIGRRTEGALDPALDALPGSPFGWRHYHAWMQLGAGRVARRRWCSGPGRPRAAAPLAGGVPYVVTVHDLSVLRMPRSHPWQRWATVPVALAALRGARRLIVPSGATADELVSMLRVDRRRIAVVPHAPSPWAGPDPAPATDPLADLRLRPGGYVLATGTVEPRKNHARLVEAFELLVEAGHDLRLVICGELAWGAPALLRRVARSPQRERISCTGYLPRAAVRRLIECSAAVCYVSLYEGYGLPVIEAMAAGAAVVTSEVSSMPEVAGGAAVLVDPRDANDIAFGIEQAIGRREELIAAGRERAAGRSWGDVARETIEVYRQALEG